MSHQKETNKGKKEKEPLRKLPSKRATRKNSDTAIKIDLQSTPKNISSKVALAKRKISGAPKSEMPHNLKPMLATQVEQPFNDKEWQFELKLDGYRALAYLNNGKVDLRSRNNLSFNKKFKEVFEALK